jgi:hypothetical protein
MAYLADTNFPVAINNASFVQAAAEKRSGILRNEIKLILSKKGNKLPRV